MKTENNIRKRIISEVVDGTTFIYCPPQKDIEKKMILNYIVEELRERGINYGTSVGLEPEAFYLYVDNSNPDFAMIKESKYFEEQGGKKKASYPLLFNKYIEKNKDHKFYLEYSWKNKNYIADPYASKFDIIGLEVIVKENNEFKKITIDEIIIDNNQICYVRGKCSYKLHLLDELIFIAKVCSKNKPKKKSFWARIWSAYHEEH